MDIPVKAATLADFERMILLPEYADKLLEFIGGEIVEVPSNAYSSEISANIIFYLKLYLVQNRYDGHVTGEQGGYKVGKERYAPDVAYISSERQPELAEEGYNPNPPELAVEVLSPSDQDNPHLIRMKVSNYLAAGTVVWVVDPKRKLVEIHTPGQAPQVIDVTGSLHGGAILPGLALAVKDIFPRKSGE